MYRAEPYGVFVDDLVSALTGGVTRVEFTFVPERRPFRLEHGGDFVPGTVRIQGLAANRYHRFLEPDDFTVAADGTIEWVDPTTAPDGRPATNPDPGSRFYASYERVVDPQAPPTLTDRNPGSIVRTLAESFAREYAVVSRQLEAIYDAAFLETAHDRELDALAALVGVERRSQLFAAGEVVFGRTSPAPAAIFVPEGTLISTSDAPAITVETTEDRTLVAGSLSVAVPVRALATGAAGTARAGALTVLHRPILGIQSVTNPEPMTFGGGTETDETLRRRVARALDTGGASTRGAIVGALTSVEGIREQDVRIEEDHVGFPGLVKVFVAAELDDARARRAAELLDRVRPAGVQVAHNLRALVSPAEPTSPGNGSDGDGTPATVEGAAEGIWFNVGVKATVTPASSDLTDGQREALTAQVRAAVEGFVAQRGIGETVVYNALVAAVMAVEGVFDVVVELFAVPVQPAPPEPPVPVVRAGRRNLAPKPTTTRPRLAEPVDVRLRGALIALDVTVAIERIGLAETADPAEALEAARADIQARLDGARPMLTTVSVATLSGPLAGAETYAVDELSYRAEFVEEGLVVSRPNLEIAVSDEQQVWIRSVQVTEKVQA